jgi:TolB protein
MISQRMRFAAAVLCLGIAGMSAGEINAQVRVSQIAYTAPGEDGSEIWIMNADGTDNRFLGRGSRPAWSPDGTKIAFTIQAGNNTDIYFMNAADGSAVTRLTTDPARDSGPAWSPDGSMIAFNSNRSGSDQIWRSNVEAGAWGYNLTQLTQDTPHNRVNNFIAWSPNGLWIVFEADRDRDDPEIYLVNAVDGTNQQRLTWTRALDEVPAWSPDSKQIIFSSDMHDEPQSGTYDIYSMNIDGSKQTRLTHTPRSASYPSMSPDGRYIAYSYSGGDGSQIWIMKADGSDKRMLLEGATQPKFSPF